MSATMQEGDAAAPNPDALKAQLLALKADDPAAYARGLEGLGEAVQDPDEEPFVGRGSIWSFARGIRCWTIPTSSTLSIGPSFIRRTGQRSDRWSSVS